MLENDRGLMWGINSARDRETEENHEKPESR
jgi:hypothetical protein